MFGGFHSDLLLVFNFGAQPDAELENPLELLRAVKPAVVVADGMSGQIVVQAVQAAGAMGEYVVRFPIRGVNEAAADVATAARLSKHFSALRFCERNSSL